MGNDNNLRPDSLPAGQTLDPPTDWAYVFFAIVRRDLSVYFRYGSAWMNPLVFVFVVVSLFAIALAGDARLIGEVAAGVLWVVALLGILLSLDALFRSDFDDGSLEQMLLVRAQIYVVVLAKIVAHWLVTVVPIVLLSPVLAVMLSMPLAAVPVVIASLLLGSGLLVFIGSIGAALTVSLRTGGLLMALLILPLAVPVVIFGSHAIDSAMHGWEVSGSIAMLGGLFLLALVACPWVVGAALRMSIDT